MAKTSMPTNHVSPKVGVMPKHVPVKVGQMPKPNPMGKPLSMKKK